MPGAFRADMLGLLKRILGRARSLFPRRHLVPEHLSPSRKAYHHFLHWAKKSGYPRRASLTPIEFGRAIGALLPETVGHIDALTQHYVAARYGRFDDEGHGALEHWQLIRRSDLKRAVAQARRQEKRNEGRLQPPGYVSGETGRR